MSGGSVNKELLLNTVKSDMASGTSNAVPMIRRVFPGLSDSQCADFTKIIEAAMGTCYANKV